MKKPKSVIPIAKIKNNLRRLHTHCKYRNKAKQRSKIDSALFKCEGEGCSIAIYEGSSEKNYLKLVEKYQDVYEIIRGKIEHDHEIEVIDPKKGYSDWNTYIERLWCDDSGYNMLCSECHAKRTKQQMEERAKHGSLKRKK